MSGERLLSLAVKSHLLLLRNFRRNKREMFETKKDYNETEMRTLIELLFGSIAVKEQALSLWAGSPTGAGCSGFIK